MIAARTGTDGGVTEMRPRERKGLAPERRLRRAALNKVIQRSRHRALRRRRHKFGGGDRAAFKRQIDADFVGLPRVNGRRRRTPLLPGRTIQSRPRARTREPGEKRSACL